MLKKLLRRNLVSLAAVLAIATFFSAHSRGQEFAPNWVSLSRHAAAPEWFQDAKLGIYFHWGPYSVPAFHSEWYPRNMHLESQSDYKHHLETYGHPSQFGYHDFVPMFKAEHFDADDWAQLFQDTGARFAGPVAEHHDGFSMWDSDVTPWNAKDMGPQRDITGELATALRKRDMKLITTFHHARNLQRNRDAKNKAGGNSHYPFFENMPPSSDDPQLRLLYGNLPEKQWLKEIWLGKLKEVVNKFHPDIIWFDSWLDQIPEHYRQEFCAYYLNDAKKQGKEVVIVRKQDDLPLDFTVLDHEKSRASGASQNVWMTDDTISTGSWCYTSDLKIKPASEVIHALVDTVSKNGVVLLNLSPKADGTIPEDQRKTLTEIGQWMKTHGEAIYATRPWITYGEGPTKEPEGGFKDHQKFLALKYSAADWRYTRSKDGKTIYAISLGTPPAGSRLTLKSFAPGSDALPEPVAIKAVSVVGSGIPVEWENSAAGLVLGVSGNLPDSPATVFRVELK